MAQTPKPVGLTKDVGYQVGVRQTLAIAFDQVWDFIFSKKGLAIWLGQFDINLLESKNSFSTLDGIKCRVSVFKPHSHIRLKWQPKHWHNNSTLQLRVIQKQKKTIISIHQEHLTNQHQRTEMKAHWKGVIDLLVNELVTKK